MDFLSLRPPSCIDSPLPSCLLSSVVPKFDLFRSSKTQSDRPSINDTNLTSDSANANANALSHHAHNATTIVPAAVPATDIVKIDVIAANARPRTVILQDVTVGTTTRHANRDALLTIVLETGIK